MWMINERDVIRDRRKNKRDRHCKMILSKGVEKAE